MLELIQHTFMQRALLGALFTIILCAVVGVLIVVNRITYIAGGVSHASYGGIGIALWLGLSPTIGAVAVAVIIGAILALVRNIDTKKADALVSAFWASGMATGIILNELTPGYTNEFLSYLFGNLLLISDLDLILTGTMAIISVFAIIILYKPILAISADANYSVTLGMPAKTLDTAMLVFLCVSVVTLMKISGLILVMALLSMPASIAESRVKKLSHMMFLSGAIAAFSIISGIWISVLVDLPPSGVIVVILTLIYLINYRFFIK